MNFHFIEYQRHSRASSLEGRNECFLIQDNWDDYGLRTSFSLVYLDAEGIRRELGVVKILNFGMTRGFTTFPEGIESSANHAALGQDQSYYETLLELDEEVRIEILEVLRDVVWSEQILAEVEAEDGFGQSLSRSVGLRDLALFRATLHEEAQLTEFDFNYQFPGDDSPALHVEVTPKSIPPTNVHAVIGRNGVGKSKLLNSISRLLVNRPDKRHGRLTFRSGDEESTAVDGFSGMVTVAFSAFDEFTPPLPRKGTKSGIKYSYIGLQKSPRSGRGKAGIRNKSPNDMKKEFVASVGNCLRSARKPRWIRAMKTLESDPVLSTWGLSALGKLQSEELETRAEEVFSAASSGHKIVLLAITRLVELVGERTLVLVDEPEAHLHPPLAASFVRALSDLLVSRNGVALLATHSPVIVQEVPANCVSLFFRSGSEVSVERPDFETFAGSLGRITRSVFGVEVGESGFRNLIFEVAQKSDSLEDLHDRFDEQLGAEGRGLARAIWRSRRVD